MSRLRKKIYNDNHEEEICVHQHSATTTTNDNNNNNNNSTATPTTKYWTDTRCIASRIRNQSDCSWLCYTRALSHQFGQMRLMIYYKFKSRPTTTLDPENNNDTNDDDNNDDTIIQSFDLLKVTYRATGKAGLANKGGIVAEVAIQKTTFYS